MLKARGAAQLGNVVICTVAMLTEGLLKSWMYTIINNWTSPSPQRYHKSVREYQHVFSSRRSVGTSLEIVATPPQTIFLLRHRSAGVGSAS